MTPQMKFGPTNAFPAKRRTQQQETRPSPPQPRDTLSRAGATKLAARVRLYWLERGRTPMMRLRRRDYDGLAHPIYEVRSNMRNGLPPKTTFIVRELSK